MYMYMVHVRVHIEPVQALRVFLGMAQYLLFEDINARAGESHQTLQSNPGDGHRASPGLGEEILRKSTGTRRTGLHRRPDHPPGLDHFEHCYD